MITALYILAGIAAAVMGVTSTNAIAGVLLLVGGGLLIGEGVARLL
jgi:hypothetical protein